MIYFRCYVEDYDGATRDLSLLEHGAYFALLRHYYTTELPLPANSDKLARICKAITLEERAAIDSVLDRYFIQRGDGWHNERADHEISVSQTARSNGSRGGRPNAQSDTGSGSETEDETGIETGPITGIETEQQTGEGGGSGHPPNHLTKTTLTTKTNHLTSQPPNQPPSADAARRGVTVETWEAYKAAYFERYGEEPVRNQRVNGQLASVVKCIGSAEAPAVAAFYVKHNRADYVKALHPTSLLSRDAESLRTAWAAGRCVTDAEARQIDRTQANGSAFTRLLEEAPR